MMDFVKEVTLCEVGPRDGLQNEKKLFTVDEKVELINASAKAGFPVIEVGSFVSPKAVPQMANTDDVFKALTPVPGVEYRALIANLNRTPAESVAGFGACCDAAKAAGIGISGSISMAFGSPWDKEIPLSDVKEIVDAYLAVGVTEISLSDASGVAFPSQVYGMCDGPAIIKLAETTIG